MKERASEKKVLEEGLTVLGQGCIQRKIKVRVSEKKKEEEKRWSETKNSGLSSGAFFASGSNAD